MNILCSVLGLCAEKNSEAGKSTRKNTYGGRLREFSLFSLEKMMLKGNITLYSYLKGHCNEKVIVFLGHEETVSLHQGVFGLDTRENFCTERVVKH